VGLFREEAQQIDHAFFRGRGEGAWPQIHPGQVHRGLEAVHHVILEPDR
jgi:hypothetical protein